MDSLHKNDYVNGWAQRTDRLGSQHVCPSCRWDMLVISIRVGKDVCGEERTLVHKRDNLRRDVMYYQ